MESEITQLFKQLALQLKTQHDNSTTANENEQQNPLDVSISKLNQSLNLNDQNSSVRVLDTALSLMCFKAPQVFDSVVEYQVKTIVSVLSGSVGCKLVRCCGGDMLQVGSSIWFSNIEDLVAVCLHVIGKLDSRCGLMDFGMLSKMLIDAVVRSAALSSRYRLLYPFTFATDVKSSEGRCVAVSNLLSYLPGEYSFQSSEIPSRLFLWYLDPANFERHVTKILQDTIERPFICLKNELHKRKEWSYIIICLTLAPFMFIEARALLHRWFLLTGLASILEFLTGLVSVILDVVSRPTWWGLPMELGLKISFSKAYFPYQHNLLQTLLGPLSSENLLCILQATSEPSRASIQPQSTIKPAEVNIKRIDHKSAWALAINFSNWFHFASLLLFYEKGFQDQFSSYCSVDKLEVDGVEQSSAQLAAKFISWILSPISKSHQHFIIDCLTTISESWTLKQYISSRNDKDTAGVRKRLKKSEPIDHNNESDFQAIRLWLEKFHSIGLTISRSASSEARSSSYNLTPHQYILFRKIPLGIFIGYLNLIDVQGCELLLHYAATGRVLQLSETTAPFVNMKESLAGSCLVFMMTDWVESMSPSLFETEEHALDFICQVKLKASRYLIKCLNRLIQVDIDEDGVIMLQDLFIRLVKWKQQGKESEISKELDSVIINLCHILYST